MSENTDDKDSNSPAPSSDNGASASDVAKNTDHMVPKARLDEEIRKRSAVEQQMNEMAESLLSEVPEKLKPLVPEGLSPAEKIQWFNKAKATGVFNTKVDVPETDTGKPKTTPREPDLSQLPARARMAAAYGKK